MNNAKFNSRAEALEYISGDKIECLECGKSFYFLANHLRKSHGMSVSNYRDKFNIPAGIPLAGLEYREKHRTKMTRLIADGIIDHHHLSTATEKARSAGRGERRDFDLDEQAKLIKKNARHEERTLPPGSKRANGKDADREREYQRAYRALKKGDPSLMDAYKKGRRSEPE